MKNLFKNLMLVAVAAMGFTACEQVIDDVNAGIDENTVTMTFVAGAPESRTSVSIDDDGNVAKYSWSTGDQVGFYYVDDDNATGKKKGSNAAAIAADGTATFNASFGEITGASAYNIGAFYPSDSWDGHAESDPFNNVNVKIPAGQALTDGSFDRNADLMMSKPFMGVALSPDDVKTLEFTRIAAIGKMNLKLEGMEEGEIINKVRFSFADGTHFNGPVSLDLENGDYTLATVDTSNCVELSGELAANADRTAIYFTCFPGEYSGDYTIDVTTDKATYSKTGTLSNALLFSAGDVLNFNATVGHREVREVKVVYTLVTNVADLAVGDKVIIVAKDHTAAMSTAQNENNRGEVAVSKKDNTISYVDEPQILTLEAGKTSGTFAFNTGSGYLYAASSSKNWLRTETTLSANSSWSITIAAVDGTATIKAQGSYTRNVMQYNQASALFACYSSASQKALTIYKEVKADTDGLTAQTLSFPESVYTITMGDTFTAPTVSGAQTTVTYTSSNTDVATVNANSGAVTVEGTGTTTITASAIEANGYRAAEASYTLTVNPVGGGDADLGASYSFDVTQKIWSSWGAGVKCGDYTWMPNKVTVEGSAAVGNFDSNGSRGQQFGAGTNGKKITSMTMTCSDYTGGIKSLDVKACAKSGNTVTVNVTVGGVEMNCAANSATISGSNSAAIATFNFTSDTALSGEIVITYSIDPTGALYVSGFAINNN